jgi:hypothetical protein
MKREPSAWGYNCATLFLGHKNTGTSHSGLRESRIWDSKIWSWVPWDLGSRMTTLARTSTKCKRQTRPLIREGATHQQTRNSLTIIKIWSCAPDECLTPRHTGRLTFGRNITWTLANDLTGHTLRLQNGDQPVKTSTSHNPMGLHGLVEGQLYLYRKTVWTGPIFIFCVNYINSLSQPLINMALYRRLQQPILKIGLCEETANRTLACRISAYPTWCQSRKPVQW